MQIHLFVEKEESLRSLYVFNKSKGKVSKLAQINKNGHFYLVFPYSFILWGKFIHAYHRLLARPTFFIDDFIWTFSGTHTQTHCLEWWPSSGRRVLSVNCWLAKDHFLSATIFDRSMNVCQQSQTQTLLLIPEGGRCYLNSTTSTTHKGEATPVIGQESDKEVRSFRPPLIYLLKTYHQDYYFNQI